MNDALIATVAINVGRDTDEDNNYAFELPFSAIRALLSQGAYSALRGYNGGLLN